MTKPHKQFCSIARALNLLGDSWTLIIVREAFYGATRFSEFRTHTNIAKNILADRLTKLVDEGVLEKRPLEDGGTRFGYHLTDKGRDLFPVLVALGQWGDKWTFNEEGPPVIFTDRKTGQPLAPLQLTLKDGTPVKNPARLRATATPNAHRVVKARFGET